jgi:hypothetical protein
LVALQGERFVLGDFEFMLPMLEQRVALLERRLAQMGPGQNNEDPKKKILMSSVTFFADDQNAHLPKVHPVEAPAPENKKSQQEQSYTVQPY